MLWRRGYDKGYDKGGYVLSEINCVGNHPALPCRERRSKHVVTDLLVTDALIGGLGEARGADCAQR